MPLVEQPAIADESSFVYVIYDIRLYGDAVLRRPAAHVKRFDARLKALADYLWATQAHVEAIGLAAVQIGVARSVFSIDGSSIERRGRREVLVNPYLVDQGGEVIEEEGCLSFPGIFVRIARPEWVIVRAQDLQGRELEREAKGYLARAYLHEIDHLQGRLFIDLMDPETRARVVKKMQSIRAKGKTPAAPMDGMSGRRHQSAWGESHP